MQEERLRPEPEPSRIPLEDVDRAKVTGWAGEHWDAVFAMLYRLCGNRHEAEDLTQETFLRAGSRHASFEGGTNIRAWLMRIAVNAHVDGRRRRRVARTDLLEDAPSPVPDPGDRVAGDELARAIEAALTELPETARIVFLLRTRESMSFAEIAVVIETSEATARWHMLQARRELLKRLQDFSD